MLGWCHSPRWFFRFKGIHVVNFSPGYLFLIIFRKITLILSAWLKPNQNSRCLPRANRAWYCHSRSRFHDQPAYSERDRIIQSYDTQWSGRPSLHLDWLCHYYGLHSKFPEKLLINAGYSDRSKLDIRYFWDFDFKQTASDRINHYWDAWVFCAQQCCYLYKPQHCGSKRIDHLYGKIKSYLDL